MRTRYALLENLNKGTFQEISSGIYLFIQYLTKIKDKQTPLILIIQIIMIIWQFYYRSLSWMCHINPTSTRPIVQADPTGQVVAVVSNSLCQLLLQSSGVLHIILCHWDTISDIITFPPKAAVPVPRTGPHYLLKSKQHYGVKENRTKCSWKIQALEWNKPNSPTNYTAANPEALCDP